MFADSVAGSKIVVMKILAFLANILPSLVESREYLKFLFLY